MKVRRKSEQLYICYEKKDRRISRIKILISALGEKSSEHFQNQMNVRVALFASDSFHELFSPVLFLRSASTRKRYLEGPKAFCCSCCKLQQNCSWVQCVWNDNFSIIFHYRNFPFLKALKQLFGALFLWRYGARFPKFLHKLNCIYSKYL